MSQSEYMESSLPDDIALKLVSSLQGHFSQPVVDAFDPRLLVAPAISHLINFTSVKIEEPCRSTQLAAMTIAKKSGSILSYDPNLRLPLWPSADAAREGIM